MKLCLRPPEQDAEWRICRMLLPETFAGVSSRTYLLGLRDESPRIVAAASFCRGPEEITHLRLHVVPPFRRSRVGSQVIEHVALLGARSIGGVSETIKESAAVPFCERNGFERVEALTTVEADMAEMRNYTGRLRDRVIPARGARTIPLSEAPADQVASLHAEHVAQGGQLNQWRGLVAHTPQMAISPVVMIDGRVAGILLGDLDGTTAVVRTRVVAPGYHGGWVNVMLLAAALDIGWAAGARRARFSYTDSNSDTRKLALRFKAEITSVVVRFTRESTNRPDLYTIV
jgi:GNAT superfamily N-acetyltransferase